MINRLHIRNFALIDDLVVEFGPGLNIITGETGAGKSILIGALGLLLGERARTETLRAGSHKQFVEGRFTMSPRLEALCLSTEIDVDPDGLIIQRELGADGRGKVSVNGKRVTLSDLKKIGNGLIDLHGQHQHQSLLHSETHCDVLDQYAGLGAERARIGELFRSYDAMSRELRALRVQGTASREKEELYRFQCREIDDIDPQVGEEESLESERRLLENSEHLFRAAEDLFLGIHESDGSVLDRLSTMRPVLESMVRVDPSLQEQANLFETARGTLADISDMLLAYKERIEFNPDRLEEIRDRLGAFSRLKRKYGGSLAEVCARRRVLGEHLSHIDGYDERLTAVQRDLADRRQRFQEACLALSEKRVTAAHRLEKVVETELMQLGMKRVRFRINCSWIEDDNGVVEVEQERYRADDRGLDQVEYYFSPNIGEEIRPLARIASGGEISRVMLALKSALAGIEGIPTMVFDEIDIGIGGRVAEVVGEKLKRLAGSHQIICITHLPQIASLSQTHYSVVKSVRAGRTVSTITRLSPEEKIDEIARLLGGASITPIVRTHAREMVERAAANESFSETP